MATQPHPYVTPEQYLEYDRNSEVSNEYIFGEIVPMEAITESHSLIAANVIHGLKSRISGGSCRVYASGPRTCLDPKKVYAYPDVTVVCGQREYHDNKRDTVVNPKIAVEVLSPSTSNYDLGAKARLYWTVPSMTDLIFVEQEKVWIEYWFRVPGGKWDKAILESLSDNLKIDSINCEIPVSDIYDGVELPPADQ